MSDLATRLTRIGVAAAVASAITDLVFTLAISLPRSERLVAIVMATIWLTATVVAGSAAILLLRPVGRGSHSARVALTALAGLAVIATLVSFVTPLFALLNSSPPPASPWFEYIYFGLLVVKVLAALPAGRVMVLLLKPAARMAA